jgi:hypothetical protein
MARPQVADGGTASSCEYIEYAAADKQQEVGLQIGVGRGDNNHSPKKNKFVMKN